MAKSAPLKGANESIRCFRRALSGAMQSAVLSGRLTTEAALLRPIRREDQGPRKDRFGGRATVPNSLKQVEYVLLVSNAKRKWVSFQSLREITFKPEKGSLNKGEEQPPLSSFSSKRNKRKREKIPVRIWFMVPMLGTWGELPLPEFESYNS